MSTQTEEPTALTWVIFGTVLVGLLCLVLYPFRQAGAQSLDVWARAAWMVTHWTDADAFPPGATLCAAPFCVRADTARKYVGGNPGHMSETTSPYCPEHEPHLPKTRSQYDDLLRFIYWVLSIVLSYLEFALALALVLYPFLLLVAFLRGKRLQINPGRWAADSATSSGLAIGMCATPVVWIMFAWW
jgi:hypothetical protein